MTVPIREYNPNYDPGSLYSGRWYHEYRKPDGTTCWLPFTSLASNNTIPTPIGAAGWVPTGNVRDWDVWSQEEAKRHKWHGFGPRYPGQAGYVPPMSPTLQAGPSAARAPLESTPRTPAPPLRPEP